MVTESVTYGERKGLSKKESYLLSYLAENRKNIFGLKDVEKVLNCNYESAKVAVSRLAKKGWVERIGKGKYLIIPLSAGTKSEYSEHEFIIASLFEGYIGYWSALNYYGFSEQIPNKIFIASPKRLRDRIIFGIKYKFVYLSAGKFFGFQEFRLSGFKIRISDKEKTIVDCLDKPKYSGGIEEIAKALYLARDELDFDKMVKYSLRMNNNAIIKRLGFLLDLLGLEEEKRLRRFIGKRYAILDPSKPKKGEFNSKWRLVVNVDENSLARW